MSLSCSALADDTAAAGRCRLVAVQTACGVLLTLQLGRPLSSLRQSLILLQVLCDLGTDCADCGPWRFNATGDGSDYQADMPIKRLLSKNVRVM
jgi:hypothetical protein